MYLIDPIVRNPVPKFPLNPSYPKFKTPNEAYENAPRKVDFNNATRRNLIEIRKRSA
jgi:hypothetical protein